MARSLRTGWPRARRPEDNYFSSQFSVVSEAAFPGRLFLLVGTSSDTNQESKSGMRGQICLVFVLAEPARGRISTKRTLVSSDKYERSRQWKRTEKDLSNPDWVSTFISFAMAFSQIYFGSGFFLPAWRHPAGELRGVACAGRGKSFGYRARGLAVA